MNILSIENTRNELINFLENTSSRRLKAKRISEFFSLLIEQKSYSLIESYLLEFLPKYLDYLKTYSPIGINPDFTQNIVQTNTKLIKVIESAEYKEKLNQLNLEIENKLLTLNKILAGEEVGISEERKAFFPLIEEEEGKSINQIVGAIDSITIKFSKAKQKDKFIIVPSEPEKDKQLEEQINICWEKAKEFSKKYVRKLSAYHEIIISFDGNLGVYRGESLGAALTIAMIEELLRFYNSPTVLEPIMGTAFTGGISERGKVHKVSKDIVEKKVEICFYSNCKILAVPKEDETFALNNLDELYKLHPKRNLRIVGVSDLEEILIRRDLVEIKKQKLIVRAGKFVKKNWVSAVVTVLLAVLFAFLFVWDWDDNPAILASNSNTLFVKNRNGKILWAKRVSTPKINIGHPTDFNLYCRIYDVDNNGKNEVLFGGEELQCFNHDGTNKWTYSFRDLIEIEIGVPKPFYGIQMIDTVTLNNKKCLFLFSGNKESFSSAIYKIDLESGIRLPGTFWCSGHTVAAKIKNLDDDDEKEILSIGVDNGFKEIVIFAFNIDTLTRVRPSTQKYMIKNFPIADLITYIRLPKTDYDNYIPLSMPGVQKGSFHDDILEKKYNLSTTTNNPEKECPLWIKLDYNMKDFDVIVTNSFSAVRDSLVAHGKLMPPYSNAKYIEQYKRKILYWKNDKWVKRTELE